MADTTSSFFNQNATIYTETNPAGPANTPITNSDTEAPSSFFKGTGSQLAPTPLLGLTEFEPVAHSFLTGLSAEGVWDFAQPSYDDIASGTWLKASNAQNPPSINEDGSTNPFFNIVTGPGPFAGSFGIGSYDQGGGANINMTWTVTNDRNDFQGFSSWYAHGTQAAATIVNNGDTYNLWTNYVYNGDTTLDNGGYVPTCAIGAFADGAQTITSVPTGLSFNTVPAGYINWGGGLERMRIDSNGNIITGGFASQNGLFGSPAHLQINDGSGDYVLGMFVYGNPGGGINSLVTRGASPTTHVAVQNSDQLFTIDTGGSDGTQYVYNCSIGVAVDGVVSSNNVPSRITFDTGTNGGNVAERLRIDNAGNAQFTGSIGYSNAAGAGVGGTVTQATSRSTGVTLNKICGAITLFTQAPVVGSYSQFVVTNSKVAATDTVVLSIKSASNFYSCFVLNVSNGNFTIAVASVSGTTSDAPVINFAADAEETAAFEIGYWFAGYELI